MFFMAVAAVCSLFLIGVISAWWAGEETTYVGELIKASLISGIVTVTIFAVIVLVIFNTNLTQLLQLMLLIFGLFYLIAAIFSVSGAMFYAFILRNLGMHLAYDPASYLYSMAAGLIPGLTSMGFISLNWNGLKYITIFQLLEYLLIFSAMAMSSGILMAILLRHRKNETHRLMLLFVVTGLIVGVLTFIAPMVNIFLKGDNIPLMSLVFYALVIPLPIIAAIVLALIGGALVNNINLPPKTTDVEIIKSPLYSLNYIKLGFIGGIFLAIFMFLPILVASLLDSKESLVYYRADNTITMISFFIVPIAEVVIGIAAVRYTPVRSMREAAAIAGMAGSISVFILFMGEMAKEFMHIYFVPLFAPDKPLLDMYASLGLDKLIICYPFILLALLTIAVCSGVFEYSREKISKRSVTGG